MIDLFNIIGQGLNPLLLAVLLSSLAIFAARSIFYRSLLVSNLFIVVPLIACVLIEFWFTIKAADSPRELLRSSRYLQWGGFYLAAVSLIPSGVIGLGLILADRRRLVFKLSFTLLGISIFLAVLFLVFPSFAIAPQNRELIAYGEAWQYALPSYMKLRALGFLLPVYYVVACISALILIGEAYRRAKVPILRQNVRFYGYGVGALLLAGLSLFPVGGLWSNQFSLSPLYLVMIFIWQAYQDYVFPPVGRVLRHMAVWLGSSIIILFSASYFGIAGIGHLMASELLLVSLNIIFIVYFSFTYFRTLHQRLVNSIFNKDNYKGSFIEEYRDSLFVLQSTKTIAANLMAFIDKFLHLNSSSLYMWSDEEGAFIDISGHTVPRFRVYDPFILWLAENNLIITRDQIMNSNITQLQRKKAMEYLITTGSFIILPLVINNSLVGIVNLGEKVNGQPYSDKDLRVLREIHLETSIAISNSLLYERIRGLNETLEKKVEQRTLELKEAQQKLILSEKMASLGTMVAGIAHEINTPLSVIKGAMENSGRNMAGLLSGLQEVSAGISQSSLERALAFVEGVRIMPPGPLLDTHSRFIKKDELRKKLESNGIKPSERVLNYLLDYNNDEVTDEFMIVISSGGGESMARLITEVSLFYKNVRNARYSIDGISKIVQALKSYSHLDREAVQNLSLQEGIENTLIIMNTELKKGIELSLDFQAQAGTTGYAGELNQVWTNLLNNAIHTIRHRYGDKPGGRITIRTYDDPGRRKVVVELEDNGEGMPVDVIQKIWDPFFTTKDQGEGSGLGLGIVQNILAKHNADIDVMSELGKGTKFIVKFPIASTA